VAGEFSASQPTSTSQPVTVTFGYIGVAHWAELIRSSMLGRSNNLPTPKVRQGKVRLCQMQTSLFHCWSRSRPHSIVPVLAIINNIPGKLR